MKIRSGSLILLIIAVLITVPGCVKKLHQAAETGNLKQVKAILEENPEVINETDSFGMTALHWAVSKHQRSVVAYLLEKGADVDIADNGGDTPLRYALNDPEHGRSIAVMLIIKGARLPEGTEEAKDILGDLNPLHRVAQMGQLANVKLLLEKYPGQIDARDRFGRTALYWAARADHIEIVNTLLDSGANIDAATPDGWTPLLTAIYNRRTSAAEILIARGANVNVKNEDGETPLHWAAKRGKSQLIEPLVEAGADVNAKTNDGETPLDWASDDAVADQLRKHGAKR